MREGNKDLKLQIKETAISLDAARTDARRWQIHIDTERQKRIAVVESELEAAGVYRELADRNTATTELAEKLETLHVQLAETGEDAPAPIGSIYVKWEKPKYSYGKNVRYAPTGEKAVLSVITPEISRYRGCWGLVGQFTLIKLKKDGTLSRLAAALSAWHGWHLEGVDPNKEESAE
jgi:hypothetical protein